MIPSTKVRTTVLDENEELWCSYSQKIRRCNPVGGVLTILQHQYCTRRYIPYTTGTTGTYHTVPVRYTATQLFLNKLTPNPIVMVADKKTNESFFPQNDRQQKHPNRPPINSTFGTIAADIQHTHHKLLATPI